MLAGVSLWLRRVLYLFAVATSAEPYLSAHAARTVPELMRHMSGTKQQATVPPSPPSSPQLQACVAQIELWNVVVPPLPLACLFMNTFFFLESRSRL